MSEMELSSTKLARRDRILDATEHLATRHGFRATSMEAIAREAGLAKATIYAYFKDKEAAFVAVAERMAAKMSDTVERELAQDGTLRERVSAALIAKHRLVHDAVRTSTHAKEIFAAGNRLTGELFAETDAAIKMRLAVEMTEATTEKEGLAIARLLFASAQGIANSAPDFEVTTLDIQRLVSAIVPSGKSSQAGS